MEIAPSRNNTNWVTSRLWAMASLWPRSSAPMPGYAPEMCIRDRRYMVGRETPAEPITAQVVSVMRALLNDVDAS